MSPEMEPRFDSLLDCVAQGIYRRGLAAMAAELRLPQGNLSVSLRRASPRRKFGIDDLERYIEATGDKSPVYYLTAKYC